MGCNCGNSNNTKRCGTCDECSSTDSLLACIGVQIEHLKSRDDQLKAQVEVLNTGVPFDALCPVQSCEFPDCPNTGSVCDGKSPTGAPVSSKASGCGESGMTDDCCADLGNKIRILEQRVTKTERQICEIRKKALKSVLLDNNGAVRGGLAVNGDLMNFSPGSWEAELAAQGL